MTIGEIIQRVQILYSKGVQSDDTRLRPRHIYNKIVTVRSKLISQEANKKQKLNHWNFQTLPCLELEEVPVHECPCLPAIGCTMYRTKQKLPKPLTNLNRHLLTSVTSVDGSVIFNEIDWKEIKYKSSSKYTSRKPDYFIRDQYLWVHKVTDETPMLIFVEGLFEDPIEVEEINSICDCGAGTTVDCSDIMDTELLLDNEEIDTLVEICVQELIGVFSQSLEDQTNNTKDSPEERSK